jgi:hypothetical protein
MSRLLQRRVPPMKLKPRSRLRQQDARQLVRRRILCPYMKPYIVSEGMRAKLTQFNVLSYRLPQGPKL